MFSGASASEIDNRGRGSPHPAPRWRGQRARRDGQVRLFKAFDHNQNELLENSWILNFKAGCLTGGWRRYSLGWQLLASKSFAPFSRSNVDPSLNFTNFVSIFSVCLY